ncbi:pilus assembly protein TadG-related protein [Blastopirellula sp. J2-11]|uniref:pilus assembly protein TadG-related protein n=1 Tax=Blastopirellula sp. J2-11 TaxID=2943192 RepID=UPI0021C90F09|nr:pilus assembly protein TadG-related protein [Blastopirellula sp. J2-11]UUO07963.1 pilus assembly protein TadG-related protein [Blastopirellula sp. J2-11]
MQRKNHQRRSITRRSRRGVSVLWLIVIMPLALTGLIFTIETGRLWLARAEVEDALEAAALAGVIEWDQTLEVNNQISTQIPRQMAAEMAESNTVQGINFAFSDPDLNYLPYEVGQIQTHLNGNKQASGELIFGAITQTQPTVIFDPEANPLLPTYYRAVLARSAFQIPSQCSLGGFSLGPFTIQSETVAMIDEAGRARIVRIDAIATP